MIALPLTAIRPLRFRLPAGLRAALPAVAWGGRWFALGLALGALTDVVVRLVA